MSGAGRESSRMAGVRRGGPAPPARSVELLQPHACACATLPV